MGPDDVLLDLMAIVPSYCYASGLALTTTYALVNYNNLLQQWYYIIRYNYTCIILVHAYR